MQPKPGEFYYHFKHDPAEDVKHHAYEVIGVAHHTETEEMLVIYRPCYELDFITQVGADSCARPLAMWADQIDRDGYRGPRFIKIEDAALIEQLRQK